MTERTIANVLKANFRLKTVLGQKVSLHFHDVALTEVIRHIATVHGINIAMKTRCHRNRRPDSRSTGQHRRGWNHPEECIESVA